MRETARGRASAAWLSLALLLGACSDDDDSGDSATLPCDIRELACQRSVFAATARLREQTGAKLPPIRVISRATYAEETRSMVAESMTTRSGEVLQGALRLLRFLPPDSSVGEAAADSSIEGVAAYYHKLDRNVTIIDDAARDAASGTFTLSHEFVHALQDQREDLRKLDAQASSADGALAIDALVEGEAVVLSDLLQLQLRDGGTPNFPLYFDRMLAEFLGDIATSPAPLTLALMTLPYPVGGRPLANAYVRSGIAGIQGFYQDRPKTFTTWVDGDTTLPRPLRCGSASAPLGYELYGIDRLGGAGLLSLYTRLKLTGPAAFEAARAWTNDLFAMYATPTNTPVATAVAWRIGLRDAAAATALEEALRAASLPQIDVTRTDNEVLISGTTDAAVLAGWTTRTDCVVPKSAAGEVTRRIVKSPLDDRVFQHALRH